MIVLAGLLLALEPQEPPAPEDPQLRVSPGDDARLELGRRLDLLRGVPGSTLAAWLRLGAVPAPGRCREIVFLSAGAGQRSAARAALWIRGTRLLAVGRSLDREPARMLQVEAGLRDGDRRHVAATFDYPGRRIRLYLDGALLAEGPAAFEGASSSDTPVATGWVAEAGDLRVYARVLAEAEIARLAGVRPTAPPQGVLP
jgi:hypothetical protein